MFWKINSRENWGEFERRVPLMLQIVFQTSETACHAEGTCWGVDSKQSAIIKAACMLAGKTGLYFRLLCRGRFLAIVVYCSSYWHNCDSFSNCMNVCLAQLVTIIVSKKTSPDTQERKRFYILEARKVKKICYYIISRSEFSCSQQSTEEIPCFLKIFWKDPLFPKNKCSSSIVP